MQNPGLRNDMAFRDLMPRTAAELTAIAQDPVLRDPKGAALVEDIRQLHDLLAQGHAAMQESGLDASSASSSHQADDPYPGRAHMLSTSGNSSSSATHSSNTPASTGSTSTGTSSSSDSRNCAGAGLRKGTVPVSSSSSSGRRHAPAAGSSGASTSSTHIPVDLAALIQADAMISRKGFAQSGVNEILDKSITAVCCSTCRCDSCASSELQSVQQNWNSSGGSLLKSMGLGHTLPGAEAGVGLMSKMLPVLAARLFDPAGGHKLAAAQDALQVLQRHVIVCILSNTASAQAIVGGSRKWALNVALAASKSGLFGHLCRHLDSFHDQLQIRELQSRSATHSAGTTSTAVPYSSTDDHTAGSSQQAQQPTTQHLLAQLLVVYQWTAAMCRIWPSSITDAAPLRSLLSSTLAVAGQLVAQLPHMQADTGGLSTPASAEDAGSAAIQQAVAGISSSAGKSHKQASQLPGPVTAAVLEAAAMVLEPLGFILHQQQHNAQQLAQPPSLSAPAKQLCAELQGDMLPLLQAMLTVCLHQLVLHAERKHGPSTNMPANPAQQHGEFSPIESCIAVDGSSRRTIAEIAEGYLLQHADTLQAKQPAASSRAAVAAWRAVCERQWARMALPLTLQDAATVLASIHPGAAAASSSSNDSSATPAAAAAVWALQECGTLGGHLGLFGQGLGADSPAASISSGSRGHSSSSGMADKASSSWHPFSMAGSTSTSGCDSSGPAECAACLSAALGSQPILSIDSCIHKAIALSALCQHLAKAKEITDSTGSSSCGLAPTLLATAAAVVSLTGAAALPLVCSAASAVSAWLSNEPSAAAAAGSHAPRPGGQPSAAAAASSPACPAAASGSAHGQEDWLQQCLCLAAQLTTAVLQLEGQPAVQLTPGSQTAGGRRFCGSVGYVCARLLLTLLHKLHNEQTCRRDTTTLLRQLLTAAYTSQLCEAAIRRKAALLNADKQSQLERQNTFILKMNVCCSYCSAVVKTTLTLMNAAGHSVLESLQGQLLLQSCTSMLLTCNSVVLSRSTFVSPYILTMVAQLLQLLQHSEAAAGGSSCGMSQSLAAGLALAGRCLVALGATLSLHRPGNCSSSCSNSSGSGSTGSGQMHAAKEQGESIKLWLSGCAEAAMRAGINRGLNLEKGANMHARIVQQALHDLLGCVHTIHRSLQQHAEPATSTAPAGLADGILSAQMDSSSADSSCSGGSSSCWDYDAVGSAGDAVQHSGRDQQQQTPPGWLLVGLDTAQAALQAVVPPLSAALAPYLQQEDNPAPEAAPASILSLPTALVAAGEAMCAAVPSSACCSNPRCTNLSGVSAGFALVRGKSCVCGGCLGLQAQGEAVAQAALMVAARYCSQDCQAAHRQQHKQLCSRLAQTAKAAEQTAEP